MTLPLACVPGAIPPEERDAHFTLLARLFGRGVVGRERLPHGYAFRFAGTAFDDVVRFIANERHCCPFLTFALEVAPAQSGLTLRLTGPAGTHEFLDAELPAIL